MALGHHDRVVRALAVSTLVRARKRHHIILQSHTDRAGNRGHHTDRLLHNIVEVVQRVNITHRLRVVDLTLLLRQRVKLGHLLSMRLLHLLAETLLHVRIHGEQPQCPAVLRSCRLVTSNNQRRHLTHQLLVRHALRRLEVRRHVRTNHARHKRLVPAGRVIIKAVLRHTLVLRQNIVAQALHNDGSLLIHNGPGVVDRRAALRRDLAQPTHAGLL